MLQGAFLCDPHGFVWDFALLGFYIPMVDSSTWLLCGHGSGAAADLKSVWRNGSRRLMLVIARGGRAVEVGPLRLLVVPPG